MRVLLDTNILTRTIQPDHPLHSSAKAAVRALRARDDELCVFPQVLYEFWTVCTRPKHQYDGFGMTTEQAQRELEQVKELFRLLADPPGLFQEWERIVVEHDVQGKNAHDARLVAAMHLQGLITVLLPDALAAADRESPAQ